MKCSAPWDWRIAYRARGSPSPIGAESCLRYDARSSASCHLIWLCLITAWTIPRCSSWTIRVLSIGFLDITSSHAAWNRPISTASGNWYSNRFTYDPPCWMDKAMRPSSPKRRPPSVLLSHNSMAPPSPTLHLSTLPISHSQQFLPLSHPQFFSTTTMSTPGFLPPGLLLSSTPIEFLFLFLVANSSLGWVCREIWVWFWEYLLIHGCILIEIREAPTP